MRFGSGASPILYRDLLIVIASIEGSAIVALDKRTGRESWKAPFSGYGGSWSTPIIVGLGDGREDLVIAVTDEIWGLNPVTGKLRWYAVTGHGQPICPSVVAKDGTVYAIAGRSGQAIAVRAGGKGDCPVLARCTARLSWPTAICTSSRVGMAPSCWRPDRNLSSWPTMNSNPTEVFLTRVRP